ncbi:MAG: hypothetical protein AAF211_33520 [Myxococcota bacterium]
MLSLVLTACLSDIRPDALDPTDAEAAARGREMMEAVAEAHGGLEAWNARQNVTVELIDTWDGFMARLVNPWPLAAAHVRLEQRLHSFDSRATFLDDDHAGLVWGVTGGRTWVTDDGVTTIEDRSDVGFMLPTMHYFTEIPYRLLEAPILIDVGPETLDGVTYKRVFATWSTTAPNAEFDQYVVYIHPETGRLAKTFYTVREMASFVTGTMNYEDYQEVDGAWMPMTMYVSPEPKDGMADNLHAVEVKGWAFDVAPAAAFEIPEG